MTTTELRDRHGRPIESWNASIVCIWTQGDRVAGFQRCDAVGMHSFLPSLSSEGRCAEAPGHYVTTGTALDAAHKLGYRLSAVETVPGGWLNSPYRVFWFQLGRPASPP